MKESLTNTDPLDVAHLPFLRKDFAGNIIGLYNSMLLFNPSEGVVSLGKLHGFELTYDGVILSVGSLDMDEENAKKLRNYILGENFTGDAFGNALGIPEQIPIGDEETIQKMWTIPLDFIHWPNHFMTFPDSEDSPDNVFYSLNQLARKLHSYRQEVGGFDQLGANDSALKNLPGFEAEIVTERLKFPHWKERLGKEYFDDDEEDTDLPDTQTSNQPLTKPPHPFNRFLNIFGKKT